MRKLREILAVLRELGEKRCSQSQLREQLTQEEMDACLEKEWIKQQDEDFIIVQNLMWSGD